MHHSESTFTGAGGMELYCQSWLPDSATRAAILIVHGLGEHSGRYVNVINALVPLGYAIYGFDFRGHGRSPGQRGHINSWSEYLDDISAYLKLVHANHPGAPVFLYGHSLGGSITLSYIAERPQGLHGAIASAPAIEQINVASPVTVMMARILSGVYPSMSFKISIITSDLTRDPAVIQATDADPLIHRVASARFGAEALKHNALLEAHPERVTVPVLFLHGEDDHIVSINGTRRVYESAGSKDKTFITYPGSFHEVHNDLDYQKVLEDVSAWLEQHL
jgi:alpha-beta hydrolase superfamily lysophospholipase